MTKKLDMKRLAIAACFLLLWALPAPTRTQGPPPLPQSAPRTSAKKPMQPQLTAKQVDELWASDLASLNLTDEQKEKIKKIQSDRQAGVDAATKSTLTPEQKQAMIDGYRRIERRSTKDVLTPEQQKALMDRMRARRQAIVKKQTPPTPVQLPKKSDQPQ